MASGLYSQHLDKPYVYKIRNLIIGLVLLFCAIVVLFPLVYMLAWSFGPNLETASSSYHIFPTTWTLDSYKAFFDFSDYSVKWLFNSFVVAFCTVVSNVVFASMAGYAFSKINFKGRNFLFFMILVAMMIPYQVTQVPLYILFVNKFKMTNSYLSLIESAKVEGASQIRIFNSIILPLSKTVLAVMAINTFVGTWNTFFWPFLVTSQEAMYTIQVGLKTFKFANGTLLSPMMAGACVSAIPMFVLFFALQKYFLEGVTIGAVKG